MFYQEALDYLNSLIDYEKDEAFSDKDIKLLRIQRLLERIGNPQNKFKSIHIAGTKGKGSTCAFIYSILKESGYKVGLYTSPHLINFRERIKVGYLDETNALKEKLIAESEICKLVEEIRPQVDQAEKPTFFEFYTALAFKFFANEGVDFAVLETGLGGRLDATNVVKPVVCGFTNISYDHMDILGDSLEKITREKAGIIKENSLVITAPQDSAVWKILNDVCKEKKARLYEVGRDFIYDPIGQDLERSIFDFKGVFESYEDLRIHLIGQHQLVNATLALGCIQLLKLYDIAISSLGVKKGLENARWPGRFQIVNKNPYVVFDGAQNGASAHALRMAWEMLIVHKKLKIVLGVSKNKDVSAICDQLCREADEIILTQAQTPRAMDMDTLEKTAKRFNRNIKKAKDVQEALKMSLKNIGPEDLIVVTGSLFVVGEALQLLKIITFPKF